MNATVIIPAYEPGENLLKLVDRVWDLGNQIIVVDDGSSLSKKKLFVALSEKAIVIHHVKNQGKGAAIKTALQYIKDNLWACDVIGIMDADGQHLPEDMEKVLMKVDYTKEEMFLGVRKMENKMPLKSRIGNKITRSVFYMVSRVKVSDTQTGLRAFSREMMNRLLEVEGKRYEYETNVLLQCAKNKIPIIEVPVKTIYHDENNSCSHFHPIWDSLRIYKDIVKFVFSSLSGFFLDYLFFCIFTWALGSGPIGILLANIFGRILSGSYNYLMNCRWVFHELSLGIP